MITVDEALTRVFALCQPLGTEHVPLAQAAGRVLAEPARALRDQPPFPASAMDGYALRGPAAPEQRFRVVGQAPAGHGYTGEVKAGEALRIFTGAPVLDGLDRVVIQEDVLREGEHISLRACPDAGANIRAAGQDFRTGDTLSAPRRLRPVDLALLASMNLAGVSVARRPVVAIIPTGDELVMPGEEPRADQIVASNVFAIKAMAETEGAIARLLPIARDDDARLRAVLEMARGADVIVTIGGASVGDHDIVEATTREMGAEPAFYKLAMRPGKPLMAGRLFGGLMLGLPGNPVSAIVCAHLFLLPALRALQGLGAWPAPTRAARLAEAVPSNGPRAHYMRARLEPDGLIRPFSNQDSAMTGLLGTADALLIRPIADPARPEGHPARYIPL